MTIDLQNTIALIIVATAASYVLRGVWRFARSFTGKASSCGSCGSCSAGNVAKNHGAAVTIDLSRPE